MSISPSSGMRGSYAATGSNQRPTKIAGYNQVSLPTISPETMQLYKMLLGGVQPGIEQGLGQLSSLASGDENTFAQLEAPAYSSFKRTQSALGSQFAGQGLGGLRSSAFANAGAAASSDLAEQLQSQRLGLQRGALSELLGLSKTLLGTQTHENLLQEKKRPKWESFLAAGLPIAGGIAGAFAGGPGGAKIGSTIGSYAGQAFL